MKEEKRYWLERDFVLELLKQVPAHIFWKDKKGVYLGCNDTFANALGFSSPGEVVGKTDFDLPTTREESEAFRKDDKEVITSKKPKLNIEEEQTLPNGNKVSLLTNKVPLLDRNKNVVGILGIYHDITWQKELFKREKQAIADKVKAEQAQADAELQAERMQALAATIAHELRTPLGSIDNMATWLELIASKLKDGELKQKLTHAYELISGETAKTNAFITIILESLSELKDKSFERLSMKDCINEAVDRFPYEADEKKFVHTDNVNDFDFMGNREMVIHVLFNLIKNALYFGTILAEKLGTRC